MNKMNEKRGWEKRGGSWVFVRGSRWDEIVESRKDRSDRLVWSEGEGNEVGGSRVEFNEVEEIEEEEENEGSDYWELNLSRVSKGRVKRFREVNGVLRRV